MAIRKGLEPSTSSVTGWHSKPTELPDPIRNQISVRRYAGPDIEYRAPTSRTKSNSLILTCKFPAPRCPVSDF